MISFLSPLLISVSVIYLNIIVIYKYFFEEETPDLYSSYFLIFSLALLPLSFKALKNTFIVFKESEFKFNKPWFFITLFFLGIAVFNLSQEFSARDIWLDEYMQFKNVTTERIQTRNILWRAANEQQPPIDYYFSSMAFTFFGWKDYAVRFHAIVFYFLTILTLSSFLLFKTRNLLATTLGLALYTASPLLRYFSIEGRPVTLASFFGLLFLIETINYFDNRKVPRFSIPLLLSIILFSLSVGLQPLTIILLLSIVVTLTFYFSDEKEKALDFFKHNAFVAVIISPILFNIYRISQRTHQFVAPQSSIDRIMTKFLSKDLFEIFNLRFLSFDQEGVIMAYNILLLLAFCYMKKLRIKKLHLALLVFLLLFPPYFLIIFHGAINWFFMKKYIICFSLIFLTIMTLVIADFLNRKHLNRNITATLIFLLLGKSLHAVHDRNDIAKFEDKNVFTRELYDHLRKSNDLNYAINFNFLYLGQWRGDLWISHEFYSPKGVHLHRRSFPQEYNFFVKWGELPRTEFVRISLVEKIDPARQKFSIGDYLQDIVPVYEAKQFGQIKTFTFRVKYEAVKDFWNNLLNQIRQRIPEDYAYMFVETKMAESMYYGRYQECLALRNEYKSLVTKAFNDAIEPIDSVAKLQEISTRYDCEEAKRSVLGIAKDLNNPLKSHR